MKRTFTFVSCLCCGYTIEGDDHAFIKIEMEGRIGTSFLNPLLQAFACDAECLTHIAVSEYAFRVYRYGILAKMNVLRLAARANDSRTEQRAAFIRDLKSEMQFSHAHDHELQTVVIDGCHPEIFA